MMQTKKESFKIMNKLFVRKQVYFYNFND